ncbi:HAD domain-containing protein [Vibrio anguillarum]|uniref:HAD domain-containing protein n=1 Tax=Vibrio anguillarum TaxID=55601 RepID=UPI0003671EA2|nr:HAD domain-containing protein [Vibrio anguillarum]
MFSFPLFRRTKHKEIENSVVLPVKATLPIKRDHSISTCCNGVVHQGPTLFYDVDGVLHPNDVGNLSSVNFLISIIDKVPSLQLVMSSNWRETMDLEFFERIFPKKIKERTIGFTPVLDIYPYRRQREIEAFATHFNISRYLCIDDQEQLYESGWHNLYIIDRSCGLDDKNREEILDYFDEDTQ